MLDAAEERAEQERLILDSVDRFLAREVAPHAHRLEAADEYPEAIVAAMKELGLFGAIIPEEYGGLGLGPVTYAKIIERIARVWMSVSGIINSHLIMAHIVARMGTEEQKRHFLPRFASGETRGGLALTEPDCGTDLQAIRTAARREGNEYVINGTKTWISNGIHGHAFAVLVKTDPAAQPRHKGMSLFIAEKGEGFRASKKLEKLGYKGIDSAELIFDDFRLPGFNLIGGEGNGMKAAIAGLELGRVNVAARGVGVAQAALDEAVRYAQTRKTFGKPIAEHQAIALKLGDMATRVEAARLLTEKAAASARARRARRHGSRHGQAVRHRGGAGERHRGHAHPWRLWLFQGVPGRAPLPRRPAALHRRGHERNAAPADRQAADREEPGVSRPATGPR